MNMRILIGLMTIGLSVNALAAIPKNKSATPELKSKVVKSKIKSSTEALKSEGRAGLKKLRSTAFNKNEPLKTRWVALMTLAKVGGPEAMPELEAAIKSSDWFMRDAGLQAMAKVNPKEAVRWARHLVSDPALVVRTSAIKTLKTLNDKESMPLLWEKLYSQQNYRGQQSLWVRHHIVSALGDFAEKGQEEKFVKILEDKDSRLHIPAKKALRKLTGVTPVAGKKEAHFWQEWWSANKEM